MEITTQHSPLSNVGYTLFPLYQGPVRLTVRSVLINADANRAKSVRFLTFAGVTL